MSTRCSGGKLNGLGYFFNEMKAKPLRRIVIDTGVIEKNWRIIKDCLGAETKPIWVIKSHMYGLGLKTIKHVSTDIAGYGVEDCEAALIVNHLDPTKPIYILYPISPVYFHSDCLPLVWSGRVIPTVESKQQIDEWVALAERDSIKTFGVQLKMRSYGGRFGVESKELVLTIEYVQKKGLDIKGVFSHPSCSTVSSIAELKEECDSFVEKAKRALPETPIHFSDSACVMQGVGTNLDRVRVGMLPLGLLPLIPDGRWVELKPAFTVYGRVTNIHSLSGKETIGYTKSHQKTLPYAAIVALGYAHGIPRVIGEVGYGWWQGKKILYASKPWMEFSPFGFDKKDITLLGSEVEILGPKTPPHLFAKLAGKAPEEFVCKLSPSINREIV